MELTIINEIDNKKLFGLIEKLQVVPFTLLNVWSLYYFPLFLFFLIISSCVYLLYSFLIIEKDQ
jgi:hypothetical protein